MSKLFSPITFRGVTCRNRVFVSPIRQQTGMAVGTVGLITNPIQAEQIVATGLADLVFLARELLRNPYWPLQATKALGADHAWSVGQAVDCNAGGIYE